MSRSTNADPTSDTLQVLYQARVGSWASSDLCEWPSSWWTMLITMECTYRLEMMMRVRGLGRVKTDGGRTRGYELESTS